jgi:protein-tyrosine phosphatase
MLIELSGGLANARDVGGLAVAGGGRTRFGVLFRSDAPLAADREPALRPWPPTTVIDLRSPDELPPVHPLVRVGASVHSVPLLAKADPVRLAAATREVSLPDLYAEMLAVGGAEVAHVAELLACRSGACLVHCAVGKDRTGVVVAVVLSAVGVSRADIIADYQRTQANMAAVLERIVQAQPETTRERVRARLADVPPGLFETNPLAIERVLDTVNSHPDQAAGWLLAQGLSPAKLDRLRERLVDNADPRSRS